MKDVKSEHRKKNKEIRIRTERKSEGNERIRK